MITQKLIQRRRVMKSYDKLKAEMEIIQQQMVETKKNELIYTLNRVKRFCKELALRLGALGSSAKGRKTN